MWRSPKNLAQVSPLGRSERQTRERASQNNNSDDGETRHFSARKVASLCGAEGGQETTETHLLPVDHLLVDAMRRDDTEFEKHFFFNLLL